MSISTFKYWHLSYHSNKPLFQIEIIFNLSLKFQCNCPFQSWSWVRKIKVILHLTVIATNHELKLDVGKQMNGATKTKESLLTLGKQTGTRSSFPWQMRASVQSDANTGKHYNWIEMLYSEKLSDMESETAGMSRKTWVQTVDAKLRVPCLFTPKWKQIKEACMLKSLRKSLSSIPDVQNSLQAISYLP